MKIVAERRIELARYHCRCEQETSENAARTNDTSQLLSQMRQSTGTKHFGVSARKREPRIQNLLSVCNICTQGMHAKHLTHCFQGKRQNRGNVKRVPDDKFQAEMIACQLNVAQQFRRGKIHCPTRFFLPVTPYDAVTLRVLCKNGRNCARSSDFTNELIR